MKGNRKIVIILIAIVILIAVGVITITYLRNNRSTPISTTIVINNIQTTNQFNILTSLSSIERVIYPENTKLDILTYNQNYNGLKNLDPKDLFGFPREYTFVVRAILINIHKNFNALSNGNNTVQNKDDIISNLIQDSCCLFVYAQTLIGLFDIMLTDKHSDDGGINKNNDHGLTIEKFNSTIDERIRKRLFILTDVISFGSLINTLRRVLENEFTSNVIYEEKDEETIDNMETLMKLAIDLFNKIVRNKHAQNDNFSKPSTNNSTYEEYLNTITLIRKPKEVYQMITYIKAYLILALLKFDENGELIVINKNLNTTIDKSNGSYAENNKDSLHEKCSEAFNDIKDLLDGNVPEQNKRDIHRCLSVRINKTKWVQLRVGDKTIQKERIKYWPFI